MSEEKNCRDCGKMLVTVAGLARSLHSGCALFGYIHDVDVCPSRDLRYREAEALWKHMDREAKMGVDEQSPQ